MSSSPSGLDNQDSDTLPVHVYVVHPVFSGKYASESQTSLEEGLGLVEAIDLVVVGHRQLTVSRIQPGAFFGKGQREEIAGAVEDLDPDVVFVNCNLSPVQQRNLEKEWNAKVLDRTGLILEIFGARAQTKEGRLQVELAALEYQRSRLVRSWTHLERQRGGAGFMGGPGETQIEIDRRLISDRITKLKKELENVRRTRELGRKSRERVPFPVVALVGYTNAGKSTLFNRLTKADVFAEDLLFATLDPTMRRIDLPNGQSAILSDTVGFISDLPTHLVAAFRATLEQIVYADAIVHVIDASGGEYKKQRDDVIEILGDLGVEYESDERIIEVLNKADALEGDERQDMERHVRFSENTVLMSALSGEGEDDLLDLIAETLTRRHIEACFEVPVTDGKAVSWLHSHSDVRNRKDGVEYVTMEVVISPANAGKFSDRYGYESISTKP